MNNDTWHYTNYQIIKQHPSRWPWVVISPIASFTQGRTNWCNIFPATLTSASYKLTKIGKMNHRAKYLCQRSSIVQKRLISYRQLIIRWNFSETIYTIIYTLSKTDARPEQVRSTYSHRIGQTVCGAIATNISAVTTADVQRHAILSHHSTTVVCVTLAAHYSLHTQRNYTTNESVELA